MIVRFPDQRYAGQVRDEMISFVDLAPTILALGAIDAPAHMQGRPFLGAGDPAPSRYIFAARDRLDEFPDRSRAVRDARFKYIRNYDIGRPLFQPLDYRENLLSMQELRRLLASGALPPQVAAYFQTPRPLEELFDTIADPHEMTNLADDPAFTGVKAEMSQALDAFLARFPDMSDTPEREMVRSGMWPGGIQPETLAPVAVAAANGERVFALESATPGASIEYRLVTRGSTAEGRWQLYTAPLAVPGQSTLQARAIRYGYKPSAEVTVVP
jgi:hypothetical protein